MRKTLAQKQGEAALANMNALHDLAEESRKIDGNREAHAVYAYQARSLKAWAELAAKAGLALPDWYANQTAFFSHHGGRVMNYEGDPNSIAAICA